MSAKAPIQSIQQKQGCFHCGDAVGAKPVAFDNKVFCCYGCSAVYEMLWQNQLCDYYTISPRSGNSRKKRLRKNYYAWLEHPEIVQKLIQQEPNQMASVRFRLPGIHCSSCLWLIEQMPRWCKGVEQARVNFLEKSVYIRFHSQATNLRKIAEMLAALGYAPSLEDVDGKAQKKRQKTRVLKIAVAGFAFANIMMVSLPDYLAFEMPLPALTSQVFTWMALLLSLPALLFSGEEFFQNAWQGMRHKIINIDAPVALAIAITFGRSLYEIFTHTGTGYLDSMSGIIFFMLLGRYVQDKTHHAITFDRDYRSFFPMAVEVLEQKEWKVCPIEKIIPGHRLRIHHGEIVPVDGVIADGKALMDYSFVTGESLPAALQPGDKVFAGARQQGGSLVVEATRQVDQGYLRELWDLQGTSEDKESQAQWYDVVAKHFTWVVLVLASAALFYWWQAGAIDRGWKALTTVLIVACPCALLLARDYVNGNVLRLLGLNGFFVKNASVLQAMQEVNHIAWDKTGTLTAPELLQVQYVGELPDLETQKDIMALLGQSSHPLSKAVFRAIPWPKGAKVLDFKEWPGQGIEAWAHEKHIRLGNAEFVGSAMATGKTAIYLSIDGQCLGHFEVQNIYRKGILDAWKAINTHYKTSLLSGDSAGEANKLKALVTMPGGLRFYQKPSDKASYLSSLADQGYVTLMIGDGINDAIALKKAKVGVAVAGTGNPFTPACDAMIQDARLHELPKFMELSRAARRVIAITFALSAIYNMIGLWFCLQGLLQPVIAAILMPASSITIMALSYGLTQWKAQQLKLAS